MELTDSLKAEQSSGKESAAPKPPADTVKKVVESQLKDYCKNNNSNNVKTTLIAVLCQPGTRARSSSSST